MAGITFKRGDNFVLNGAYQINGAAAPLPPVVRAQLRDAQGSLVCELTVIVVSANAGTYTLSGPADTSAWPLGVLYGDVQFTDASNVVESSDTFTVAVIPEITHA